MKLLLTLTFLILSGCASRSDFPKSADEINFDDSEGKTGWSRYGLTEKFKNTNRELAFSAAKSGLAAGGFNVVEASRVNQVVVGEHGITAHDWNVMAAVYYKQVDNDMLFRVISQGSKDVGFNGDTTGDAWAGKIMNGIRSYLNQTTR